MPGYNLPRSSAAPCRLREYPCPVIIAISVAIIFAFVTKEDKAGEGIALGGNEEAAAFWYQHQAS